MPGGYRSNGSRALEAAHMSDGRHKGGAERSLEWTGDFQQEVQRTYPAATRALSSRTRWMDRPSPFTSLERSSVVVDRIWLLKAGAPCRRLGANSTFVGTQLRQDAVACCHPAVRQQCHVQPITAPIRIRALLQQGRVGQASPSSSSRSTVSAGDGKHSRKSGLYGHYQVKRHATNDVSSVARMLAGSAASADAVFFLPPFARGSQWDTACGR